MPARCLGQATNDAANLVLGGGILQYTGVTASTDRSFTLTAATTSTIEVLPSDATLTIGGGSAATTGALVKSGDGTLELTGTNNHTGTTTVAAGKLVVNGSTSAGSNVSVSDIAILAGSGTIGGDVTVAGTLAPGNSPGVLTISGNTTM